MSPLRFIVIVGTLLAAQRTQCEELRRFPDGFQFGAATASYQIEGAWNVSDKSENIWDRASHTPGKIRDGSTGDVAADSYHQIRRDVEMARELGLHFYRFSLSWTRLVPTGVGGPVSEDGRRYYNELIDELLRYNITPMVAIYHWDLPMSLQDLGGWANPLIGDWFEDFARVAFDLFADRVPLWLTINEPLVVCGFGYGSTSFSAVPYSPGIGDLLCTKHVLLAHARVWRLYDQHYRSRYGGKIGPCNHMLWFEPVSESPEDVQLAEEANQLYSGLYTHAIFSEDGGWPPVIEQRIAARSAEQGYLRSRLPAFSPQEIQFIKGTYDFFGFNHYTSKQARRSKESAWPLTREIGIDSAVDPSWETTESGWFHVNPIGIRKMLKFVKERYNSPRVLITENGYSSGMGLHDDRRVRYYRDYLNQVLDSIYLDGVNITHYTAWSLMDNFEWNDGYQARFGLYEIDFEDPARTRRARKSALVYKHIVRTRSVDPSYEPASLHIAITDRDEL